MREESEYKYYDSTTEKYVKTSELPDRDKWFQKHVYRRYTEKGTGPAKGMYKVGDVRLIREKRQEYILVKYEGQEYMQLDSRKHIGSAVLGKELKCEVIAITQRRNCDMSGSVNYYDSNFKVRDEAGREFWNSGSSFKWNYVRIGTVVLADDLEEVWWRDMNDERKKLFLEFEGEMLDFVCPVEES